MIGPQQFEAGIGQMVDHPINLPDVLPWADVTLCDYDTGDRLTLALPENQVLLQLAAGGLRIPRATLESRDDSTVGDTFDKVDIPGADAYHGEFKFSFLNYRGRRGHKTLRVGSIIVSRLAVPETGLIDA